MFMISVQYTPSLQPFTVWGVPVVDTIFTTFIIYYSLFFISLLVGFFSMVLSSLPFQPWISTAQILVEETLSLVCCKHLFHFPSFDDS